MEVLYSKLYDKYTKLKKEKESRFDKLNHDQEVKFLNYEAAADEMIQYLKRENEKLNEQVDEMKSELALIRSSVDEQHTEYQKLLMEESQKNKELTETISRFKNLQHNQCSNCTVTEEIGHGVKRSLDGTPPEKVSCGSLGNLSKKRKSVLTAEDTTNTLVYMEGPPSSIQQPVCCQKKILSSGGDDTDTSSVNCVFQYLIEFAVGMKVSPLSQSKELCVLAHHQSTGYSFSLTWIHNSRGEVELLYHMSSLGTLERVAPEWMKETLMFSTSMCNVFFERISRVIKS